MWEVGARGNLISSYCAGTTSTTANAETNCQESLIHVVFQMDKISCPV